MKMMCVHHYYCVPSKTPHPTGIACLFKTDYTTYIVFKKLCSRGKGEGAGGKPPPPPKKAIMLCIEYKHRIPLKKQES